MGRAVRASLFPALYIQSSCVDGGADTHHLWVHPLDKEKRTVPYPAVRSSGWRLRQCVDSTAWTVTPGISACSTSTKLRGQQVPEKLWARKETVHVHMIPRPQMPSVNQWHDRVVREATACGEVVLPSVHREVYGVPVTGVCEHKQLEATFSWSVPDGPVPPTMSFARHHTFIHHKTSAGMVEWPTGFLDGLHERFDPEKSVTLRGSCLGIIYCVLIWVTHVHVPGQGLVSVSWHHLWRERDGKEWNVLHVSVKQWMMCSSTFWSNMTYLHLFYDFIQTFDKTASSSCANSVNTNTPLVLRAPRMDRYLHG